MPGPLGWRQDLTPAQSPLQWAFSSRWSLPATMPNCQTLRGFTFSDPIYLLVGVKRVRDTHVGVTRQLLDPEVSRLDGKHLFLPSPLAAQRSDLISFLFVVLCIGNRASCPYLFLCCYYYEECL